jgi:uncharacterized protein
MQLEHSFTVPVGADAAWKVLLDIERIAPCMPGAAIDTVDGDDFTGTVKVKLGPIGLTYKGKASFIDKDEAAHRVTINAQGRDSRGNGTAAAKVTATLTETDGQTRVDVITDLDITGKPAQFGRGVMVDVGNKLIGQFADCLAGKLAEGDLPPAAEAASAEPAADTAAEPVTDPVAAPAKKASPAKAAPAKAAAAKKSTPAKAPPAKAAPVAAPDAKIHSTPAAAPTSASGAASAKLHSAADVAPIDLLQSAGPAVAKRLAPLVALVVLVLIVVRLRRR